MFTARFALVQIHQCLCLEHKKPFGREDGQPVHAFAARILLFLQSHLAESQFPLTQSAHSLEVVANSTDSSPKHTISPENGCGHISLSNTIYRHPSRVEPSPCFGWKRHLESRLYVRPKKWKTAGYKRQRDIDSLCRESARELPFCHRLSITCDGLSSRRQGMRNLHCPPLAWNPLCWL